MICEFAITPQVFDDQANATDPQWVEHLRELSRNLYPNDNVQGVIVSDLYDGSWQHEARNTIVAIRDQSARELRRGC